jgi:GNAT superfamily N-acetyltransferase
MHGDRARPIGLGAVALRADMAPRSPMLNRLLGLGVDEPATEEALDLGIAALEGTRFYVSRSPAAKPAELEDGWRRAGSSVAWDGCSSPLPGDAPLPVAGTALRLDTLDARLARRLRADHADWLDLPEGCEPWLREVHEAPGWMFWAALDGDDPAGTAGMFIEDGAAYLGFAATLPEHRGKGAQSALLARRPHHARSLGCTLIPRETGERVPDRPTSSYRNLLRTRARAIETA